MIKILIYDSKDNNFNLNDKKYIKMIKISNKLLHHYYNGGIINPPFVDKIIVIYTDYTVENIHMLYNSLNMNGKLCLINTSNYISIFKNYTIYKKFIIVKRKNNYIYTIPKFRVIEFIIMGAQKGGTTALAHNISKHPDIYINPDVDPLISEMRFFSVNWEKGIEYYKSFFDYSKKIVGEKTANYIYLPHTFPLIQQVNPYVKLIISLRNPATRAFSHWKMIKERWGAESFEEELENELKYYYTQNKTALTVSRHFIRRGFYYNQLIELFKWFPRHNILILLQEEILQNMNYEYNKVYKFLNLNEINEDIKYEIVFETKNKDKININTYNKLMKIYKEDILKVEKLLNIKTNWL
jgi:hypothetical protein